MLIIITVGFFLILMDPFLLPWLPPVGIIFSFLFLSHDISHSMLELSIHQNVKLSTQAVCGLSKMQKKVIF